MKVETVPSQIGEIFESIQNALGEKYSNLIFSLFALVSGLVISFVRGPILAAILFASLPLLMIIIMIFGGQIKKATMLKMGASKTLGGAIEESLTAIRVIASFNREEKEL